ncbi:hypothetical protein MPTK1_6g09480 [Marchantia polymorpha subsp. ruderalis]|uniref:Uncharacterized protein n=2 Tax=Marchantia polymorpha TaxID=3197 RepID=A0AAF6BQ90_MARPO|nr:hypothetical protein MARPO_0152s0008 [Marchantia polymorpha]BBN14172.1 hypothetical protein Mp_6g09480 [Marchantia polymorpha subsp. ruderalis]PTQ28891.1 hypothetical protein MARPO_0152s0008 [Marchantia polymorpha]PTQ28892.1 hypothetical protein MARPO_0152s0008 [Marchantia polymorpha]BBN14173.1 hypothetical protein Mp_6g09480 [Marchantia polymorpha subsp. ruderalis]|eukprot:PTQ28890.1 hypothetical protein MARPO_0152s0008 [Marchantia polymorpha]
MLQLLGPVVSEALGQPIAAGRWRQGAGFRPSISLYDREQRNACVPRAELAMSRPWLVSFAIIDAVGKKSEKFPTMETQ